MTCDLVLIASSNSQLTLELVFHMHHLVGTYRHILAPTRKIHTLTHAFKYIRNYPQLPFVSCCLAADARASTAVMATSLAADAARGPSAPATLARAAAG